MRPKSRFWLLTFAAVAGVLATLALGRWQLSRAAQKEALQAAIEQRRSLPPLEGSGWTRQDAATLLHRPVRLRGRFVPEQTVFLDNRQMYGRPGFFVLTPLKIEGSEQAVVVQRGWAPRNFVDRVALPSVATPDGVVQLEGRIAPAPAKLFEFETAATGRIRQNLDLDAFARESGLRLLPLSVLQTSAATDAGTAVIGDGLARDWPVVGAGIQTHYGYAFQWFGLAALIAFLYVWYQFILPRRRHALTTQSSNIDV